MVLVIVGVLIAIAAPSWLSFINRQKVHSSQGKVFTALRKAQSLAKRDKIGYQVSFRSLNENLQLATHPTTPAPTDWNALPWESVGEDPKVPTIQMRGLGAYPCGGSCLANPNLETSAPFPVRRARFDYKGNSIGDTNYTYIVLRSTIPSSARGCIRITGILASINTFVEGEAACPVAPN